MTAAVKLAVFAAALVVVFAAAFLVGSSFGPASDPAPARHEQMDHGR